MFINDIKLILPFRQIELIESNGSNYFNYFNYFMFLLSSRLLKKQLMRTLLLFP